MVKLKPNNQESAILRCLANKQKNFRTFVHVNVLLVKIMETANINTEPEMFWVMASENFCCFLHQWKNQGIQKNWQYKHLWKINKYGDKIIMFYIFFDLRTKTQNCIYNTFYENCSKTQQNRTKIPQLLYLATFTLLKCQSKNKRFCTKLCNF